MPQSPQPAELILAPELQPLIPWRDRVRDRIAEYPGEYYARIRSREGTSTRTIGDQIWIKPGTEADWIEAIAGRIEGFRSATPMIVELVARGGHQTLEAVTISPLAEAVELAISAGVQRARIEGESATILGLSEALLRLVNSREAAMNAREGRLLDTHERLTELRIEKARAEAEAETAVAALPPEPEDTRWVEGLATLAEVFGPALGGLGAYLLALAGLPALAGPAATPPHRPAPPAHSGDPGPGASPPPLPSSSSSGAATSPPGPKESAAPIVEIDPDTLADHLLGAIEELASAAPGVITSERKKRVASWLFRFREGAGPVEVPAEGPAVPVEVPAEPAAGLDEEGLPPEAGDVAEEGQDDPGP